MTIADVQVRRHVPNILSDTADMVATQPTISYERFKESAVVINAGRSVLDRETGQTFHAVVYVLLTESKEAAEGAAEALKRVHDM